MSLILIPFFTSVPTILYPKFLTIGINSIKFLLNTFILKIIPSVALITLELYKSTELSLKIILETPKAIQERIMVPKFPGSCTPSKIKTLPVMESSFINLTTAAL